jgi:type IV pilus assembly protein PilE
MKLGVIPLFIRGVTLVELMTVVAIVAILASVSYPAYNSYVLQSRRSIAINHLLKAQSWLEQQQSITGAYPTTLSAYATLLGVPLNGDGSVTVPETYYLLYYSPAVPYALSANGNPATTQIQDTACYVFLVYGTGYRVVYNSSWVAVSPMNQCWN